MIRRPPRSTRTDTLFPTRRSSDLEMIESGVINLDGPGSKVALVYGQMNEPPGARMRVGLRSEEHTSELQSLMRISYAVFCLKKKTNLAKQQITKTCNNTSDTKPTHTD